MTGLVRTRVRAMTGMLVVLGAVSTSSSALLASQGDIVLHTKTAVLRGDWQRVADAAAASGSRLWNPDRGAAKLSAPSVSPVDYFELSFYAERGLGYRLWLRGRADNNAWTNDSVFVQFSGSVNGAGAPVYRTGSTDAAVVSIEEGSGRGLSSWGWSDNGWDSFGPLVYFEKSGLQTVRVQRREDGISIDQLVLSPSGYVAAAPGQAKNDATIIAEQVGAPAIVMNDLKEVVFGTGSPTAISGGWQILNDATAAGGKAAATGDRGLAKVSTAYASPTDFVDYTFTAEAGRAYRLWLRGRAEGDYWGNDSVFVQFSGSLALDGTATARIGTTNAFAVNLEDAGSAGVAGWGWQDNGYGTGVLGPLVMFATTGPQTIRIQRREDGFRIDQIVLSSERFLTSAPGALKHDTVNLLSGVTTTTTTTTTTGTTSTTTTATTTLTADATEPVAPTSTTSVSTTTVEPTPAPGTPVRLRILQWNLHHGVGSDGRYDIDRIATAMSRMNPDVVLLNEVEKYTGWGNEDQPERYRTMMEAKTGRRWYSHFSQEFGQWTSPGKGHQILSVYPLDAVGHTTTTPSSGLKGAGAVSYATIIVNGRTLNFVVGHLDPYDATMRLTQAKEVLRFAEGLAENRILAGDLNAWPDQTSIAEINKTYSDAWTAATLKGTAWAAADITPWGATKKGRIDYIFVSKGSSNLSVAGVSVVETRDGAGVMPSDHRPVLATIDVK